MFLFYPLSLYANTQVWPPISQISIHAQLTLLTLGDTGYLSQVWPERNLDFLQWGGESVPVPELVGPISAAARLGYSSIRKDLVAYLRLLNHRSLYTSILPSIYMRPPLTMLVGIRNQTCDYLTV